MTTLTQARKQVIDNIKAGIKCPCCGQMAKVYERSLTAPMAMMLIRFYRETKRQAPVNGWLHIRSDINGGAGPAGDYAKLRYWGLIEQKPGEGHSGLWRITDKGKAFVEGALVVPGRALVYNSTFLGLNNDAPKVGIKDALGTKFSYDELMKGGVR